MSRFDVRTLMLLSSVYPMWWFGELCWDYPPVKPGSRLLAHGLPYLCHLGFYTSALFTFLSHHLDVMCPEEYMSCLLFSVSWYLPCSTTSSVELEPNRSGTGLFKVVEENTPNSKHWVLTTPRSPLLRRWWYKCIHFARMSQIVTKSWLWRVGSEDWHPHEARGTIFRIPWIRTLRKKWLIMATTLAYVHHLKKTVKKK